MKSHYHVLDGLRGTAAFSVLAFHFLEFLSATPQQNPMPHTHLAVDFFFALSGFVLGHAYDGRGMAPGQFFTRRLVRLHPMVVAAMVVGLLGYLLDPFAGNAQRVGSALSPAMLVLTFSMSLLLLPTPTLPNYFGETHSMNGPSWTLAQEYLANVLFALFAPRLGRRLHVFLCIASALLLLWTAKQFGNLCYGWGWGHAWVAPVRLACPFLLGLLVYRMNLRIALPYPFIVLSALLLAVFSLPTFGAANWLYEAACVIVVLPLVLMAGAGSLQPEGTMGAVTRLVGELSYPVYIVHYPFIYLWGHWMWNTHPSKALLAAGTVALYLAVALFAFALSRWYDRPVRAWLTRVLLERQAGQVRLGVRQPL